MSSFASSVRADVAPDHVVPGLVNFSTLALQFRQLGFVPLAVAYPSTMLTCQEAHCGHCGRAGLDCEPWWKPSDETLLGECRAIGRCPVCHWSEEV